MNIINLDVSFLSQPGLYKITCIKTNKLYIGQTENVLTRLGRHSYCLETNRSDCREMQEDFNLYGKRFFCFEMLTDFCGSNFANPVFRIQQEQALIVNLRLTGALLYNRPVNFVGQKPQNVLIKGQLYSSFRQAARSLEESRTQIRRNCEDPNNFDYVIMPRSDGNEPYHKYVFHPSCRCLINGVTYESLNQAAKALKTYSQAVKKRLDDSINFPNDIYLD